MTVPVGVLLTVVLAFAVASALGPPEPRQGRASETVVFVCEHGNAKSLIAREWFNRLAVERSLHIRAVSRGVAPEPGVPHSVAEALRSDGFDVRTFEAAALSEADLEGAVRLVGIGVDLSSAAKSAETTVDTWEGIPPASKDYAASRDALRVRIERLLNALQREERRQ